MTLSKKDMKEIEKIACDQATKQRNSHEKQYIIHWDNGWIWILAMIFVVIAFSLYVFYNSFLAEPISSLKSFRSFELEKYNYNESECVEGQIFLLEDSRTGITTKTVYSNGCTLYCHQTQVKVGEECRNIIEGNVIYKIVPSSFCRTNETYTYLPIYGCAEREISYQNKTVCTPTYRTERGFCADVETIAKAKELVK